MSGSIHVVYNDGTTDDFRYFDDAHVTDSVLYIRIEHDGPWRTVAIPLTSVRRWERVG